MKTIEHNYADNNVCIYKCENNTMIGSFFKDKPEINDIIIYRNRSWEVIEILENRDAKISPECSKDNTMAYFKLLVG